MVKGHDRQRREAKKPKADKKRGSAASTFLRPQPGDKPSPPKSAGIPPDAKKP